MSAQTGTSVPAGPVSQKVGDRARFRFHRLLDAPNPLWIRELRQAARLVRTPVILCVLAILATLLIASIGGLASINESPATTGFMLFQVFFSLAYFIVTLVGPGVAANGIASEREGRTWEAVTLTGLRPEVIARGKFLAAYTSVAMYIVMLAPVGALPFLFGGVTATETIVAFAFLFLIAGLAVAFGLAISSKMNSLRAALVVTLICAFIVSLTVYFVLGVALSAGAHDLWSGVTEWAPVWLPLAYARAPFDLTYVLLLVFMPIALAVLPAWFLYEVTIANLTSITDDRSSGLKRWFLFCTPIFALSTTVPVFAVDAGDRTKAAAVGICLHFMYLMIAVYLFAGDSLGPSRRVRLHWDRQNKTRFARWMGPGIVKTSVFELIVGAATLLMPGLAGLISSFMPVASSNDTVRVVIILLYAAGFFLFSVGFAAFLRSRTSTTFVARILLLAVHFFIAVGPWVVAAIAGILASASGSGRGALVMASPSPLYVFVAVDAVGRSSEDLLVLGSFIASAGWALLGLLFLALARSRTTKIILQHEAALAQSDRLLAEEDEREAREAEAARAALAGEAKPAEPQAEAVPQPAV